MMPNAITDHIASIDTEEGFTLLELVVGLLIAGILAAIFLPDFITGMRTTGHDQHVIADTTNVLTKSMKFRQDYNKQPTTIADLDSLQNKGEGNEFALVASGDTLCILGSHPGSNYTVNNPHTKVIKGFIVDAEATSCPLNMSGAVWR